MDRLRALLAALAWLVAAVAIALGGAGLVTAMDAPPAGGDRPELTTRGDAQVVPALDAIEAHLRALSGDVDALGTQARGALAALGGNDFDTVDGAIARGDELLEGIAARVAEVRSAISEVPLVDEPAAQFTVSTAVMDRYERLRSATTAVEGLDVAWARLTTGSVTASRLSGLMVEHDRAVLAAAEHGRDAEYDAALDMLDEADAAIAEARRLRNLLVTTVDVAVLDQWLDRNEGYDLALRALYAALDDAEGRVTDEVREAIAAEQTAKERLPGDSRPLIVIMAEIGRGGVNDAVIEIEQARGRLDDAIEASDAASPPALDGSASPAP